MLYLPSVAFETAEILGRLAFVITDKRLSARIAKVMAAVAGHVSAPLDFFDDLPAATTLPVFLGHF